MRRSSDRRRTGETRAGPLRKASEGSDDSAAAWARRRQTRRRLRRTWLWPLWPRSHFLPQLEPDESADLDILAGLGDCLVDELGANCLRLALNHIAGYELGPLGLELGRRDRLDRSPDRAQTRDLDRQIADQALELVRAGDEVGLAVDFDQDADLAAGVDVARDLAFIGVSAGSLGGRRLASLLEDRGCLLDVAAGLLESALALHDACAALLAEGLDGLRSDGRHRVLVSPVLSARAVDPRFGPDRRAGEFVGS